MVGIIIDVSLFLAVLIFVMIGYFKGFLRTVVSLVGNLGAVVVAYFTKDLLAGVLNSWFGWGNSIARVIMEQVSNISGDFSVIKGATASELKTIVVDSDAGIIYKQIFSWVIKGDFQTPVTVAEYMGNLVSGVALAVIAFIIVFVLIKIIVKLLNLLLKRIPRNSFVGKANKILGCLAGLFNGLILVTALLTVVYFLNLIPAVSEFIHPYLQQTFITKHLFYLCGAFLL